MPTFPVDLPLLRLGCRCGLRFVCPVAGYVTIPRFIYDLIAHLVPPITLPTHTVVYALPLLYAFVTLRSRLRCRWAVARYRYVDFTTLPVTFADVTLHTFCSFTRCCAFHYPVDLLRLVQFTFGVNRYTLHYLRLLRYVATRYYLRSAPLHDLRTVLVVVTRCSTFVTLYGCYVVTPFGYVGLRFVTVTLPHTLRCHHVVLRYVTAPFATRLYLRVPGRYLCGLRYPRCCYVVTLRLVILPDFTFVTHHLHGFYVTTLLPLRWLRYVYHCYARYVVVVTRCRSPLVTRLQVRVGLRFPPRTFTPLHTGCRLPFHVTFITHSHYRIRVVTVTFVPTLRCSDVPVTIAALPLPHAVPVTVTAFALRLRLHVGYLDGYTLRLRCCVTVTDARLRCVTPFVYVTLRLRLIYVYTRLIRYAFGYIPFWLHVPFRYVHVLPPLPALPHGYIPVRFTRCVYTVVGYSYVTFGCLFPFTFVHTRSFGLRLRLRFTTVAGYVYVGYILFTLLRSAICCYVRLLRCRWLIVVVTTVRLLLPRCVTLFYGPIYVCLLPRLLRGYTLYVAVCRLPFTVTVARDCDFDYLHCGYVYVVTIPLDVVAGALFGALRLRLLRLVG